MFCLWQKKSVWNSKKYALKSFKKEIAKNKHISARSRGDICVLFISTDWWRKRVKIVLVWQRPRVKQKSRVQQRLGWVNLFSQAKLRYMLSTRNVPSLSRARTSIAEERLLFGIYCNVLFVVLTLNDGPMKPIEKYSHDIEDWHSHLTLFPTICSSCSCIAI